MRHNSIVCTCLAGAACFLFTAQTIVYAAPADADADASTALNALEGVVKLDRLGWGGEGVLLASPEYKAAIEQGVSILPELARRLAAVDSPRLLGAYTKIFSQITHFTSYPYSSVAFVVDNVDYYEADASTLPFLRRNLKSHGDDPLQVRDTLLVWWGKMLQSNQTAERASAMRVLTERLSADGANMTGLDYHGFSRVNINYGIFNLPVYITLIRKDNNPLAFMEFLCASSHPAYRELHLPANPVERLKIIAGKWPTQRERVEVVEQWWADDAAKYETTLPELAQSIIQAMKE